MLLSERRLRKIIRRAILEGQAEADQLSPILQKFAFSGQLGPATDVSANMTQAKLFVDMMIDPVPEGNRTDPAWVVWDQYCAKLHTGMINRIQEWTQLYEQQLQDPSLIKKIEMNYPAGILTDPNYYLDEYEVFLAEWAAGPWTDADLGSGVADSFANQMGVPTSKDLEISRENEEL